MSNATTTVINGGIILTPANAEKLGLTVPNFARDKEDFLLGYDRDDDLVAWGPADDRETIESLLRMYT